ncbi:hypothetical protein Tamer19_12030 [Cupriavidus sp. TA19]|nr:hypothetical protein Tamer19_12030 [Cupriavidus sp. TA19]
MEGLCFADMAALEAVAALRDLAERVDRATSCARAKSGQPRELAVFEPGQDDRSGRTVIGRVAAKGLADELPFRRRILEALEAAHARGQLQFFGEYASLADPHAFAQWLAPLRASEWVVYAKRPFAGRETVSNRCSMPIRIALNPAWSSASFSASSTSMKRDMLVALKANSNACVS